MWQSVFRRFKMIETMQGLHYLTTIGSFTFAKKSVRNSKANGFLHQSFSVQQK